MADNRIGSEGLTLIAEVLKENNAVKEIDVRDNEIGNHGAAKMSDALTLNVSINKLDLQKNSIKAQGAIALASSLKVLSYHTILFIQLGQSHTQNPELEIQRSGR